MARAFALVGNATLAVTGQRGRWDTSGMAKEAGRRTVEHRASTVLQRQALRRAVANQPRSSTSATGAVRRRRRRAQARWRQRAGKVAERLEATRGAYDGVIILRSATFPARWRQRAWARRLRRLTAPVALVDDRG